jgi:integral membrane protein
MKPDLKTAVGRLRVCGMLEGISFLLLLGVAMPLKYAFQMPLAVKYTGWAHGLLFIILMLMILMAWLERKISFKHAALAFVASLIPFGPFLIDRKLAVDQDQEVASES